MAGGAETARLIAELTLRDKFSKGVGTALGSIGKLEKGIGRVGKGFGQIGAGLGKAGLIIGGAAVAGIGAAAKAAIDFEDAFAGVRKTVDEADLAAAGLSFDTLARSFRDMATEIPIAATDFARIGETAGALGIKARDIETFTKTVALLGVTTNLTSDEAAQSLGKVGTILGLTGAQYTEFADILVNLGNKGASTESEILEVTKRFGASGQQAGLSTAQILAYSSAITSAGAESEAAGSSLSRLFGNLITETALGSKKAHAFAKVSGMSFKDFAKVVKNDTNGAMLTFLGHLKTLDKFEQQEALKKIGITNVRDRNAILLLASTLDTNLVPALQNAQDATGALGVESQKRFDTVASKVKLLKQNLIEAAITIGEGFAPAVGRAAEKLATFLKDPVNKGQLKALGEDIGKAIDGIDWKNVLDGAKTFFGLLKDAAGIALTILSTLNQLPTEIKTAGLGIIGLNKLSGGLIGAGIGNLIGGLAGAVGGALAKAGIGKFFVQPVFVTNMGVGGMGGGLPVAAGGLLGTVGVAFFAVTAAAALGGAIATALGHDPLTGFGDELAPDKAPGKALPKNYRPPTSGSPDERQEKNDRAKLLAAVEASKDKMETARIENATRLVAAKTAIERSREAITMATRSGDRDIVAAIRASGKPVINLDVNVSNTSRVSVYQTGGTISRTGPSGTGQAGSFGI